jgi:hypothetical protein
MLDFLVEQRLQDAVSRGELDNLPGSGRPLELDDDPPVANEARDCRRYEGFAISPGPWMRDTFASAGTGGTLASHAA